MGSALEVGVALSFNWHKGRERGRKGRRSTSSETKQGEPKGEGVNLKAYRLEPAYTRVVSARPGTAGMGKRRPEQYTPREPTHHKITGDHEIRSII